MTALIFFLSTVTLGQLTPFGARFSANDFGDILLVGNTVLTCPAADANCAAAQAGGAFNNNNFSMVYVDIDGDASTFDSSTATLSLPTDSEVLYAGLYWTGDSTSPDRGQARIATPTSAGYIDLVGSEIGSQATGDYAAFMDVTALVQAGGAGDYTVADVQTDAITSSFGGWSLIIAARIPGQPPRNLTVFDGYQVVGAVDISISLSGFQTPSSGLVTTTIGIVSAEGDLTGLVLADGASLDGVTLSDANNPANNLFNSTISDLGVTVTAKNPSFVNQLGFDIDRIDASGILANGATSATVALFSQSDFYLPFAMTFATELFAPELDMVKTMVDQDGGELVVGDVIEVTVTVTNIGADDAGTVVLTDAIPADTTFVPGSLEIVSGANAGAKTDAAGDDQAEVNGGNVVFRLGTGANAGSGGILVPMAATEIRFSLTVDLPTPVGTMINNLAVSAYQAVTIGQPLASSSNEVSLTVIGGIADLSITKTGPVDPLMGDSPLAYLIEVTNNGPSAATNIVVVDTLPASTTFDSAVGTGWACAEVAGVVTCDLPALAAGPAAPITLVVTTPRNNQILVNEALVAAAEPDPDSSNDFDTAINEVRVSALEIPTLSALGMALLALTVAFAAIGVLRRA
jgi:uncharacterized repeat protein (TIGR01451 family)